MLRSWLSHQHALDATPLAFYNVTLNKVLMHLDAMLLNFSCSFPHALDATPLAFYNVTLNKVLMHLDAMLSAFSCSFQHPLDATLLAFSSSFQPTRSWCILVLRSWLSHATSDTLLLMSHPTRSSCHIQHAPDASWCYFLDKPFIAWKARHRACTTMHYACMSEHEANQVHKRVLVHCGSRLTFYLALYLTCYLLIC